MRAKGEPSPLLRIAEKWLREELIQKKKQGEKTTEAALGVAAQAELDPSQKSILPGGGGFAAGRMGAFGFDGK